MMYPIYYDVLFNFFYNMKKCGIFTQWNSIQPPKILKYFMACKILLICLVVNKNINIRSIICNLITLKIYIYTHTCKEKHQNFNSVNFWMRD